MKIRKVVAFILSQVLCLFSISTVSFSTFADDAVEFEKVYISAVVNGKNQNLPAIQNKDGNVFFSGKTLSDVTVYNNNTSDSLFEHDKVNPENEYRSIKIDKSIKKAHLLSFGFIQKSVELPDIIEFENEVYYPIAEMLPILNANAAVSDNKLYIEDVPYSLSNIMPEFNISNYMFNIYGTDTKILSGYSYLFNGLLDFELKKFIPIIGTRINKIESYKDIFTSFLAEDEVYFEAINDEEHWSSPIVSYMYSDDSERENAIVEAFDEMADISKKEHDELIKTFTTLDSWTTEYTTIDALGKGAKGIDLGLRAAAYIELYYDHVADHYEMLDAIYDFEATKKKNKKKIIAILEESYAAAEKIHTQFNDKKKKEIVGYITKQIGGLIIDEYKDIIIGELKKQSQYSPLTYAKIGATISKLYFIATDSYVYNVSRKCENLPYYNKLMERGASKFWAYNNAHDSISKDNIEKARLSAVFTLLSSRSMYQALCDSDKAVGNSGAIYQKKISAINEALKKLYLAKNCCVTDSREYIDERIQQLNSSMHQVTIADEKEPINTFELYKQFFLEHFSLKDLVCLADVTHDGVDEMIVTSINEEYKDIEYNLNAEELGSTCKAKIYSIINDEPTLIYEINGGFSHANGFFDIYLIRDGDYYNIGDEINEMWQGFGELRFEEYYLDEDGAKKTVSLISSNDGTVSHDPPEPISDEAFDAYTKLLDKKIANAYKVYSNFSESDAQPMYIETDPKIVFNLDNDNPSSLNISASVNSYSNLTLRKDNSDRSDSITSVPDGANVTILSVPDSFKNNSLGNDMVKVDFGGKKGYLPAKNLIVDTSIKLSSFSTAQLLDIGKIIFEEFYYLDNAFQRGAGLLKYTSSEEYYQDYRKLLPAGLSIKQLESDFYKYFSKKYYDEKYNGFRYSESYLERDGYLWLLVGWGDDIWLDHFEVSDILSMSDKEVVFNVIEYDFEDFVEEGESAVSNNTFRIVFEDGAWKFTELEEIKTPNSQTTSSSSQSSNILNLKATTTAKSGLVLRKQCSTKSTKITSIPNGSTIQIIGVPEEFQDGNWEHRMLQVEYNGTQGFAHADYILCEPNIDLSHFSEQQLLDIGKILAIQYFNLTNVWNLCEGLDGIHGVEEYDMSDGRDDYMYYQKLTPKGKTLDDFKKEFYSYFSENYSNIMTNWGTFKINELFRQKNGSLWRLHGPDTERWIDGYKVINIVSHNNERIILKVSEIILPSTVEHYNDEIGGEPLNLTTYSLEIEINNGHWKYAGCK